MIRPVSSTPQAQGSCRLMEIPSSEVVFWFLCVTRILFPSFNAAVQYIRILVLYTRPAYLVTKAIPPGLRSFTDVGISLCNVEKRPT